MRFRVVPPGGHPFIQEQDKPLKAGDTSFHPPREPGTQGLFNVTAAESGDDELDSLVRVDRLELVATPGGQYLWISAERIG